MVDISFKKGPQMYPILILMPGIDGQEEEKASLKAPVLCCDFFRWSKWSKDVKRLYKYILNICIYIYNIINQNGQKMSKDPAGFGVKADPYDNI